MSKPFNLADAKAGHPVQTVAGERVEVFKYDHAEFAQFPLVGGIKHKRLACWTTEGHAALGVDGSYPDNLVMAPIGTIDGKPVYPGDMIAVYDTPCQAWHTEPIDWASAKWQREYPKTQMDEEALCRQLFIGASYKAVANAAIRHGIDNGYLLDPTTDAKNIHNAVPTFASEVERRHAIVHIERERKMIRAGIEQGWREAYLTFSEPPPPHVERRVPSAMPRSDTDVDELIASVTGAKDAKEGAK